MTKMTADTQFDLRRAQNICSCGPFTAVSEEDLFAALEDLGLCLDAEGGLGRVIRHLDGLYIEAEGPGVRGTLLSVEDGEEAEEHDVRRLLLICAEPGCEVLFTGTAGVTASAVQTVLSRAVHDGRHAEIRTTRTVISAQGGTRRVHDSPTPSIF